MPKKSTLTLPERFDIAQADAIKDRLSKAMEKDATLFEIKADKVERADSAGIQLILSFKAALSASNREMKLVDPSDEFVAAVKMLGASDLLEI